MVVYLNQLQIVKLLVAVFILNEGLCMLPNSTSNNSIGVNNTIKCLVTIIWIVPYRWLSPVHNFNMYLLVHVVFRRRKCLPLPQPESVSGNTKRKFGLHNGDNWTYDYGWLRRVGLMPLLFLLLLLLLLSFFISSFSYVYLLIMVV